MIPFDCATHTTSNDELSMIFLPFLFIAFYFVHRFLSSKLSNLMTLLLKIDVYDADIFVKATIALKIKQKFAKISKRRTHLDPSALWMCVCVFECI